MVDQTAGTQGETRRDFLYVATGAVAGVGALAILWPLVDQMNPAEDVLALSTTEVDLSQVPVGQQIIVSWRSKPVFIRHRTEEDIAEAEAVPLEELKDPETDADRVINPAWLIMVGICTHLGCVPLGQKSTDPRGDYGGYFCPCHGSHYDTSGRIRQGPAPENLLVPAYAFVEERQIVIGEEA